MKLPSVAFHPIDKTLIPGDIKSLPRPTRRIMEVLLKGSEASVSTAPKSWSLDFCLSPTAFIASEGSSSQLGGISFEKTKLTPNLFDLNAKAVGSGESVGIETSLAFRSIGYKSEALPTSSKSELGSKSGGVDPENDKQFENIPFDNTTGTIPNDHLGRVLDDYANHEDEKTRLSPGLYCAGWVKRGPTGVIASTMEDAFATAESIERDWYGGAPFLQDGRGGGLDKQGVDGQLGDYIRKACNWIDWNGWKTIDKLEKERGLSKGKEREKITNVDEMIKASRMSEIS
jgi:adrenodoxin-NADP+ reductase